MHRLLLVRFLKLSSYLAVLALLAAGLTQVQSVQSGREGEIWYFGDGAGFDFSTSQVQNIVGSPFSFNEAVSIVLNENAEIQYYCDGETIRGQGHSILSNGNGLDGSRSSGQIISVPYPGQPDWYYTFYGEHFGSSSIEPDTSNLMFYALVNMADNSGTGTVEERDILLHNRTTEKIHATRHCNGLDWWVLTHEAANNKFLAWLINDDGLSEEPVASSLGLGNSGIRTSKTGYLKFNPAGNRIALAKGAAIQLGSNATNDAHLELFSFDNNSGVVSDAIVLAEGLSHNYGCEWSSDGSKVYFGVTTPNSEFWQYDLSKANPDSIIASKVLIGEPLSTPFGGMTLGPDQKIYISAQTNSFIQVIHEPNLKGVACNYVEQGINLLNGVEGRLGLPNFPASYYAPYKPYPTGPLQVCTGDTAVYHVPGTCAPATLAWALPDGGTYADLPGDSIAVTFPAPGDYRLAVLRTTECGGTGTDTLRIEVRGGPGTTDTLYACAGETVDIFGQPQSTPGLYTENFTSSLGCDSTASVQLLHHTPTVVSAQLTPPCNGAANGRIEVTTPAQSLLWSTGAATPLISDLPAGDYTLSLIDTNGCTVDTLFTLVEDAAFDLALLLTPPACPGGTDGSAVSTDPTLSYDWAGADPAAFGMGSYIVTVTNSAGCTAVDTVTITEPPALELDAEITAATCTTGGRLLAFAAGGTLPYTYSLDGTSYTDGGSFEELIPGSYILYLRDANDCSAQLDLTINPAPEAPVVTLPVPAPVVVGTPITLGAQVSGGSAPYIYSWTAEAGSLSCTDCSDPTLTTTQSTTVTLLLTDAAGCTTTASAVVTVLPVTTPPPAFFAPNAFSPNRDGVNDRFTLYGAPGGRIVSLRVFDRWGGAVVVLEDLELGQPAIGWDGTARGQALGAGVYVWAAEVVDAEGKVEVLSGAVVLVR